MAGASIRAGKVFDELHKAYLSKKYGGYVLSGGSRSGKSYAIMQLLLLYCQYNKGKKKDILIARQQYSDLKKTIMKDFFRMLEDYGLYKEENHIKSHPQSYKHFDTTIYFSGLDSGGAHGEAHDVVWINEAFEAEKDAFDQLDQRLREFFIFDYNPCFTEHWIKDTILTQPDVYFSHSTQLDNPFLEQRVRNKILSREPTHPEDRHLPLAQRRPHPTNIINGTADDYLWSVYGLGIGAQVEGIIFKYVNWINEFPPGLPYTYAMDFGYTNDPTVLVKMHVDERNKQIFAQELCYEPIDNPSAINDFMRAMGIERNIPIIADSADKYISATKGGVEMVKDLKSYGWNISKVSKTMDVYFWITKMKEYKLNIVSTKNLKTEFENYRWRTINGQAVNQPVDKWNHGIDAIRYGLMAASKGRRKAFWD